MFKSFRHVLIAFIPYVLTLMAIRITGYIDESVLRIYIPLFLMGASPLIFGRLYIGYIFIAGVCIGLIGEYAFHAADPESVNSMGVAFNIMCMLGSVVMGGAVELLADQHRRRKRRQAERQRREENNDLDFS